MGKRLVFISVDANPRQAVNYTVKAVTYRRQCDRDEDIATTAH